MPNSEFGEAAGGHMSTLWSGLGVTGLARWACDDGGIIHVTKTSCDLSIDELAVGLGLVLMVSYDFDSKFDAMLCECSWCEVTVPKKTNYLGARGTADTESDDMPVPTAIESTEGKNSKDDAVVNGWHAGDDSECPVCKSTEVIKVAYVVGTAYCDTKFINATALVVGLAPADPGTVTGEGESYAICIGSATGIFGPTVFETTDGVELDDVIDRRLAVLASVPVVIGVFAPGIKLTTVASECEVLGNVNSLGSLVGIPVVPCLVSDLDCRDCRMLD